EPTSRQSCSIIAAQRGLQNFADETIRANALAVRPTPQTIGTVKVNFPEIVDIALPAEGVFHNLVFVSIRKTYPMQAYKIMHGLWGMGQMMFTKYIIVVDDDVDVHNTSEVLFRLCANTDPQRDSIFTKGPADVLDHATSEVAIGSKLGIDATRKLAGEGFKRPWPPLIKMSSAIQKKISDLMG